MVQETLLNQETIELKYEGEDTNLDGYLCLSIKEFKLENKFCCVLEIWTSEEWGELRRQRHGKITLCRWVRLLWKETRCKGVLSWGNVGSCHCVESQFCMEAALGQEYVYGTCIFCAPYIISTCWHVIPIPAFCVHATYNILLKHV